MSAPRSTSPYEQFGLPLRVIASRTMYWLNAAGAVALAIVWRLQRTPEGYDPNGEDWSGFLDLLGITCNVVLGMVISSAVGYGILAVRAGTSRRWNTGKVSGAEAAATGAAIAVIATAIAATLVRLLLW